jgi:membrane associated rhomboid family serine protease
MNPYRYLSILSLIAACAIVFAGERVRETSFAEDYGAVPAVIAPAFRALVQGDSGDSIVQRLSRLVTAIFLHGSPEHIVYNIVFLWTFGYLTSQILGQWWALAIFLICGICGNIVQVYLNSDSMAPIIGASGAICGLAGMYFGLALRWQLPWPEVWPIAYPIPPIQLGVFAVLGFLGDMYFLANRGEGIAYGAHAGGFLSGLAIATLITTIYPSIGAYERAGHKR